MDQFTPTTVGDYIGLFLVLAVALRILWAVFIDYCERQPIMEAPRYQVKPSNAANLLAGMDYLRSPLPQHRNMEGAAQAGVSEESRP